MNQNKIQPCLRPNPGAPLNPSDVVGRDAFIARRWEELKQIGLILSSERRMGKTSIIRKMVAEPPEGVLAVRSDVQHVTKSIEFVERLFTDVRAHLRGIDQAVGIFQKLLKAMGGMEIGNLIKLPRQEGSYWKEHLERIFIALTKSYEGLIVLI